MSAAAPQVFKSVWLKRAEGYEAMFKLAWDDRGTLQIFPDRVEYHGKHDTFSIWHIRSVEVGKFGDNPFHKWVKVRFIHEGIVGTLLFSGKGKMRDENRRIADALTAHVTPSSGPDEDAVMRAYLAAEIPEAEKRYTKAAWTGAMNVAVGLIFLLLSFSDASAIWMAGVSPVLILIGAFLIVDALRSKKRLTTPDDSERSTG